MHSIYPMVLHTLGYTWLSESYRKCVEEYLSYGWTDEEGAHTREGDISLLGDWTYGDLWALSPLQVFSLF